MMPDAARVVLSLSLSGLALPLLQRVAVADLRRLKGERTAVLQKPEQPASEALAFACGLSLGCLFLLATARPVMALLLVLSLYVLLLVLNRAKARVLREPLVLADAWLLGQVFRYPEMYFPFLPVKRIAAGLVLLCLCLALLAALEEPLSALRAPGAQGLLALGFGLPVACLAAMRLGRLRAFALFLLRCCPVSHSALEDGLRNGPLASALLHPVWAGTLEHGPECFLEHTDTGSPPLAHQEALRRLFTPSSELPPEKRPHVILIQAESFCDVRERLPARQAAALASFLPNWDALKAAGRALPTPPHAFGAYTMRTEFSMLTGLTQEDLGPFAFNPYLLAGRRPLWSLARHFSERGYATLCLHPYNKDFFRRDKVMANLGFEHFLDIEALGGLPRFGPYVSDLALGEFLLRELEQSARPVFCFAITMEAHGPWRRSRLSDEEIARILHDIDCTLFSRRVQIYLCHLRHMDDLFGLLRAESGRNGRAAPLVFAYGDHPPGLHFSGETAR